MASPDLGFWCCLGRKKGRQDPHARNKKRALASLKYREAPSPLVVYGFHMMMSLLSIAAALIALKSSSILMENEFPGMAIPPGMNFVDL